MKYLERFRQSANIQSLDDFLKNNPKEIQRLVEDYIIDLRNQVSPNSIPTMYYPIQSFLEMNDVQINFKKMRKLFPEKTKTAIERGWITEEIQRMLSVCKNLRNLALIHFEASSGGRLGLFDVLKIKHLQEIQDEKYGKCYAIIGYADSGTIHNIPYS